MTSSLTIVWVRFYKARSPLGEYFFFTEKWRYSSFWSTEQRLYCRCLFPVENLESGTSQLSNWERGVHGSQSYFWLQACCLFARDCKRRVTLTSDLCGSCDVLVARQEIPGDDLCWGWGQWLSFLLPYGLWGRWVRCVDL